MRRLAIDVETDKFNKVKRKFTYNVAPLTIPFCLDDKTTGIVLDLSPLELAKLQGEIDKADEIIFHHGKFDIPKLLALGLNVPYMKVRDTLLGFGLINGPRNNGLKILTKKYLRRDAIKFDENIYSDVNKMKVYAEADALNTFDLVAPMTQILDKENLHRVYHEVELPLIPAMIALEQNGILIDLDALKAYTKGLLLKNKELRNQFKILISPKFNPNSRKQIRIFLHEKLKITPIAFTPTGYPSTSAETLRKYHQSSGFEIIGLLADYLENAIIESNSIKPILRKIDLTDFRLRCNYNQIGTDTGRSSASEPNLQGVASDGPLRSFFVASPGYRIIRADFSQQEPRILAKLSQEDFLTTKDDLYKRIASEIFNVSIEGVTTEMRAKAKVLTIACIYGQQASSIAKSLGISYPQAKLILRSFELRFSKIYEWKNTLTRQLHRDHFLTTPLGRRRKFDFSKVRNNSDLNDIERSALNFVIQGTAADVSKTVLARIHRDMRPSWRLLAFIHDEYLIEVPEADEYEAKVFLAQKMSEYIDWLGISLVAEATSGRNWKEAKDSTDKVIM